MKLNRQEVFNVVYKHLEQQQAPARKIGSSMCLYRGYDGNRCAIGKLIKDEFYNPQFEGYGMTAFTKNGYQNAKSDMLKEALFKSLGIDELPIQDGNFLWNLQRIHDLSWTDRMESLQDFAKHYNLEIPS